MPYTLAKVSTAANLSAFRYTHRMKQIWILKFSNFFFRCSQDLLENINLFLGNKDAKPPADIQLNGLSIQPQHALFVNKDNKKVTLTPLQGAEVLVNGKPLHTETTLQSNDR